MDNAAGPLRTSDFDYPLPPALIAQTPSAARGDSRLLVVQRPGPCLDRRFADLVDLIPAGDLLVLNTTKVRHARLIGRRPSGAVAEVLLLHPADGEAWVAMGKPGSALQPGKRINLGGGLSVETLKILEDGYRLVRIGGGTAQDAMTTHGRLPLPPYIDRDPTPDDDDRYQTVFAEREGSVAAPTAGLHFTEGLLATLEARGVRIARVELEVGPGTFRPVETDDVASHQMHPERFEISNAAAALIGETRAAGRRLWAVGTTVVRALESAVDGPGIVRSGRGETRLMIAPGYRFRAVDHLITNFHLPRSTLLMLVAAFAGHAKILAAYRTAVELGYRFYSYGDAMVIL
jgi:S-adenosylmethionine:tRNA ribosyltransferase-isomerase